MAEFTLGEGGAQYEPLPDGEIFTAEVWKCEVETKPWKDDNGNDVIRVSFGFIIQSDDEFDGRKVFGETPTTFTNHPDCKLRAWIKELLGADDLPVGFKFNTESLLGQQARIVVGTREGKAADGSPKIRNYVQDLIRIGSVQTADQVF